MARAVPVSFYKSKIWRNVRESYLSRNQLCEECLKAGLITPARIVHHKIYLTAENYQDPAIAYNDRNLEAVCFQCHEIIHDRASANKREKRYFVTESGEILEREKA